MLLGSGQSLLPGWKTAETAFRRIGKGWGSIYVDFHNFWGNKVYSVGNEDSS